MDKNHPFTSVFTHAPSTIRNHGKIRAIRNVVLILSMLTAVSAPAQSAFQLVSSYAFDGNLLDQSGNGIHGIANLAPTFCLDRYGVPRKALGFDGLRQFVQLNDSQSHLKVRDAITISLWLRPRTLQPLYQNILSDHGPDEALNGAGKILRIAGSDLEFIVGGVYGSGTAVFVHQTLNNADLNRWIFVVATYDRVAAKLYIDGKLSDSVPYTQPLAVNPNPLLIGNSGFGTECFRGAMDDLQIYSRALTAAEVRQAHYRAKRLVC